MSKILKKFMEMILHSDLGDIQGGKDGEHYHLTYAEWARIPVKPSILFPANGESNVNQVPQIVGTPYTHPVEISMRANHIQIAMDATFNSIIYEKEEFSASTVFQVLLKSDETPYLTQDTEYYVRIRYQDRNGKWSEWSDVCSFRTMVQFPTGVLLTPTMLMPADGGEVQSIAPILAMSSPKVIAGSAVFDAADWQISSDSSFAATLYEAQATDDITIHSASGVTLATALGVDFFARGRQRTNTGEYTPWANPVRFCIRPDYDDPVFGMRRVFSKRDKRAYVYNLDAEGNMITIKKAYWDSHPLYVFANQDIILGDCTAYHSVNGKAVSSMAYMPPVWEKARVYENDEGDTVIDLWFSATEQKEDGWMLNPAFIKSPDGLFVSRYLCNTMSNVTNYNGTGQTLNYCPVSTSGTSKFNESAIPDLMKEDGWHLWTIYERRLLHDLMTAENLTVYPTDISTATDPMWRGLECLFNFSSFYHFTMTTLDRRITECNYVTAGVSYKGTNEILIAPPSEPTLQDESRMLVFATRGTDELAYDSSSIEETKLYNVSEIHTGYREALGMDVGLLGIPSLANSLGVAAFPMVIPENSSGMNDVSKRDFGMNAVAANRTGLFGVGACFSRYGGNNNNYYRVSKWIV